MAKKGVVSKKNKVSKRSQRRLGLKSSSKIKRIKRRSYHYGLFGAKNQKFLASLGLPCYMRSYNFNKSKHYSSDINYLFDLNFSNDKVKLIGRNKSLLKNQNNFPLFKLAIYTLKSKAYIRKVRKLHFSKFFNFRNEKKKGNYPFYRLIRNLPKRNQHTKNNGMTYRRHPFKVDNKNRVVTGIFRGFRVSNVFKRGEPSLIPKKK